MPMQPLLPSQHLLLAPPAPLVTPLPPGRAGTILGAQVAFRENVLSTQ